MDCTTAQERILERHDASAFDAEVAAHLTGCAACAAFAATQTALDDRLSRMLVTPRLSPAFRRSLRRKIAAEEAPWWRDTLPDIVHFSSWTAATIACVFFAPLDATIVLGAGMTAALVTYVPLTAVRSAFEDV